MNKLIYGLMSLAALISQGCGGSKGSGSSFTNGSTNPSNCVMSGYTITNDTSCLVTASRRINRNSPETVSIVVYHNGQPAAFDAITVVQDNTGGSQLYFDGNTSTLAKVIQLDKYGAGSIQLQAFNVTGTVAMKLTSGVLSQDAAASGYKDLIVTYTVQ